MNTPCIFPHGIFDNPQVEHGAKETMTGKAKCKRNKNTGSGNNDKRLNYWEKAGFAKNVQLQNVKGRNNAGMPEPDNNVSYN